MQQKEFGLHECYIMACYGLRAIINNGRLEGFTKEDADEIQEYVPEKVPGVREGV